jgi:spore germination cell wall hydrolase CwlJ-like protein
MYTYYSRYRKNAKQSNTVTVAVKTAIVTVLFSVSTQVFAPEPVRGTVYQLTPKDTHCLVRNVYYESANQPIEGQAAVLQTTLNRAVANRESICKTVYKQLVNGVCQFSWTCQTPKYIPPLKYKQTHDFVTDYVSGRYPDWQEKYKDTKYFHATYTNPGWKRRVVDKVGQHVFYE